MNFLLCGKVKQQFGGSLKYLILGGAPLAPKLQMLIKSSTDTILVQGYGCTETSGAVMCMDLKDLSIGRVGSPVNGCRVRLIDWLEGGYSTKDKPHPRGELVIGGKMLSTGYFQLEQTTNEAYFSDNGLRWFVTGDIAEFYPDGTFKIIDRKKDIVKLANGEFISLGKVV